MSLRGIRVLVGISALSVLLAFYASMNTASTSCRPSDRLACSTENGEEGFRACENSKFSDICYIASIDDCKIDASISSNICCKTEDGVMYECNDRTEFRAGEYVITKVNLQHAIKNAGLTWDSYKACGFNKLIKTESQIPEHYRPTTTFYDEQGSVGCSSALLSRDFHQGSADGLVPAQQGKVQLVEWRIYPADTDLSSTEKALAYYNLSIPVFSFEVNVGG